jgi:predicted RND superfamily exporter protein
MEIQQPLGIVVVGGLFSSTILTLLIIPVLYTIFDDVAEDVKALTRRIFTRGKPVEEELFKKEE